MGSSDTSEIKAIGWDAETRIKVGEASYIFVECNRKIQNAKDNEQMEERMEIYGRRNEDEGSDETSETGNAPG